MARKIKSLRELFNRLPAEGKTRHLIRNFNLAIGGAGTTPSTKKLATEMGFDIHLVGMPRNKRGRLVTDPFSANGFAIEVNKYDDVVVRRWTVLHEIMHFLLHKNEDPFAPDLNRAGGLHFYDTNEQLQEREANEFVEAIIFGDGALMSAQSLHGHDEELLSRRFGVSVVALRIALSKL